MYCRKEIVEREDFTRVYVKEHDDRFQTIHILDLYHSKDRLENRQYDVNIDYYLIMSMYMLTIIIINIFMI